MKNKLTEKCKEDFLEYLGSDRRLELNLPDVYVNALIIEFFQYKQIWERIFYVEYRHTAFMNSKHANNEAIIKANETYNKLYNNNQKPK